MYIGTCSWRYPTGTGLVYDETDGRSELTQYAAHFTTVEIDRWFWSLFGPKGHQLPDPEDAAAYADAVPEGFRFAIKVPDALTLTHQRARSKTAPLVVNERFLDPSLYAEFWSRIAPLHDAMGPLIFQFEYLNRQKMSGLDSFLAALETFAGALPTGPIYALEIRNRHFVNERLFDALEAIGWVPVLISGYWMPSPLDLFDLFETSLTRYPALVLRLLGPDRDRIERLSGRRWNRIVAPRGAELGGLAVMLERLAHAGVTPWVYVNNHYEGSAPLTIDRLLALLAERAPS